MRLRAGCRVVTLLAPLALLVVAATSLAATERREAERWVALRVSPSGLVIVVRAVGGGCGHDPRATARETSSTVTVVVTQAVPDDPLVACPALARIDTLSVRLASPINGRKLVGQSLGSAQTAPAQTRTVPRMVGLRVTDAQFSLRAQHFEPRGARDGVVRKQHPAAGTVVPRSLVPVRLARAS